MRILLFISLLSIACTSFAQTKKIAWKSHGGDADFFPIALEKEPGLEGNFGMIADQTVQNARLDSVIFICDTVAVMVTSTHCTRLRKKVTTRWKPGRDTVINHPVFSRHLSEDSIRYILNTQYYFRNEAENVILIDLEESKERPCVELITEYSPQKQPSAATAAGIAVLLILAAVIRKPTS